MLNIVDAWHTSKFCSHCGAVGNGHDTRNYALFRCKKCGTEVNSDRQASLNIAIKSLLERRDTTNHNTLQISNRRVPVNGLVRP
ncbi:MAG: zinc ribbon domain-containing protein, partial [Candidatus Acidifodinimicrobium sp.]